MNEDDKDLKEFEGLLKGVTDIVKQATNNFGVPSAFIGNNDIADTAKFFAKMLTDIMSSTKDVVESKKKCVTENETDMFADEAKNWGYNYILENFTRQDLQLMGSHIYQKVSDEVYQYIRDVVINEYDFSEDDWDMIYDALADIIYERVDFSYVWQALDEVDNSPLTFEEKLAEVGMSVRDFY